MTLFGFQKTLFGFNMTLLGPNMTLLGFNMNLFGKKTLLQVGRNLILFKSLTNLLYIKKNNFNFPAFVRIQKVS